MKRYSWAIHSETTITYRKADSGELWGRHSPLITIVALFFILLWSSAFIATKVGVTHSPPLTLLADRFFAAALLMALLARVWRLPRPQGWSAWGRLALFGLFNSSLFLDCIMYHYATSRRINSLVRGMYRAASVGKAFRLFPLNHYRQDHLNELCCLGHEGILLNHEQIVFFQRLAEIASWEILRGGLSPRKISHEAIR
jgi:hypothetical protein